jgi:membrane-bound metal-dependent hydrolase YbcI (DUF457 family)
MLIMFLSLLSFLFWWFSSDNTNFHLLLLFGCSRLFLHLLAGTLTIYPLKGALYIIIHNYNIINQPVPFDVLRLAPN